MVYLATIVILLGAGLGFYPLIFVGLILLIPALMSPSRPPVRGAPTPPPPRQETRRIVPPTPHEKSIATPAPHFGPAPPAPQPHVAPQALFPMPMFPSLSQMGAPPEPEPATKTQEGRDEVVEVGVMLALMKLAFG